MDNSLWSSLPKPMQEQFFNLADTETKKTKKRLLSDANKLKQISAQIKLYKIPISESWKNWSIACVDGSDSPVINQTLGSRYGLYGACIMMFKGNKFLPDREEYKSGKFVLDQIGSNDDFQKILGLIMTYNERKLAVSKLSEVDLMIIDGSFFGWRVGCSTVKRFLLQYENITSVSKLIDELGKLSKILLESKKVIAIVKRVSTGAINGWIKLKGWDNLCVNQNDKMILSSIMPTNTFFSYSDFFQSKHDDRKKLNFNFYSLLNHHNFTKQKISYNLVWAAERAFEQVIKDVNSDIVDSVFSTDRYYVKASQYPPCCIELPQNFENISDLLSYIVANTNPGTGLPFPIDLTDSNITIPSGMTQEFVEEVEAQLLKDGTLNLSDISNHFSRLNPQKKE